MYRLELAVEDGFVAFGGSTSVSLNVVACLLSCLGKESWVGRKAVHELGEGGSIGKLEGTSAFQ